MAKDGLFCSPSVFHPEEVIASAAWLVSPGLAPKAHSLLELLFTGHLSTDFACWCMEQNGDCPPGDPGFP